MKVIGPLQGFAAYRETAEEYLPENGAVQSEIIAIVRNRYTFQHYPRPVPVAVPPPILLFSHGKFIGAGQSFAVAQIAMTPAGDVVVALTTEQAELVLEDLVHLLDANLGFRLEKSNKKKRLLSNIVVEFDEGLERMIDKVGKMGSIINKMRPEEPEFGLKRLAFGQGNLIQTDDPLGALEIADFLIERRAGIPYTANRYYCSAPLSTRDHIAALEQIEAIAQGTG